MLTAVVGVYRFADIMIGLDLQTFQQSQAGGNVTGVIYLELRDGAFPGREWSDFPVIILGWWADALIELEAPTRREVRWRFMDGPHWVTLTKEGVAASGGAVEFREVHRTLSEAVERVVTHCDQHGMFSRDLETLRDHFQRLKVRQMTGADSRNLIQFGHHR